MSKFSDPSDLSVFIVMYGRMVLWSKKIGVIGKAVIGWTVGEDALISKQYLCRRENCSTETEAAVLEIPYSIYQLMKA
jgi:hypothetical protein